MTRTVLVKGEVVVVDGAFPAPAHVTLHQAQDSMIARAGDGTNCPCCGQRVQVYRRSLYAAMSHGLIRVYLAAGGTSNYVKITDVLNGKMEDSHVPRGTGDFCKLAHWNLIEAQDDERKDGSKRTGMWRVTDWGEMFVHGATVSKYVFLIDNKAVGFSTEQVTIQESLGQNFNYSELMKS